MHLKTDFTHTPGIKTLLGGLVLTMFCWRHAPSRSLICLQHAHTLRNSTCKSKISFLRTTTSQQNPAPCVYSLIPFFQRTSCLLWSPSGISSTLMTTARKEGTGPQRSEVCCQPERHSWNYFLCLYHLKYFLICFKFWVLEGTESFFKPPPPPTPLQIKLLIDLDFIKALKLIERFALEEKDRIGPTLHHSVELSATNISSSTEFWKHWFVPSNLNTVNSSAQKAPNASHLFL